MATIIDQNSLFAARVFYGLLPRQQPKAMYIPLDFSAAGSNGQDITMDFELTEEEGKLDQVASVFIDNSQSGQLFTLKSSISQYWLPIAGGRCGYFPMLAPPKSKFIGSVSGVTGGLIKIQFLNFTVPFGVW